MRSIGKVNIKKLNRIIAEEYDKKDLFGHYARGIALWENIEARIPDAWRDMWESADAEINRLISDGVIRLTYRKIDQAVNNLFTTEGR